MLPMVLVEARLLGRLLLFLAFVGMALDARHGNPVGMLLAAVCGVMLGGAPAAGLHARHSGLWSVPLQTSPEWVGVAAASKASRIFRKRSLAATDTSTTWSPRRSCPAPHRDLRWRLGTRSSGSTSMPSLVRPLKNMVCCVWPRLACK